MWAHIAFGLAPTPPGALDKRDSGYTIREPMRENVVRLNGVERLGDIKRVVKLIARKDGPLRIRSVRVALRLRNAIIHSRSALHIHNTPLRELGRNK